MAGQNRAKRIVVATKNTGKIVEIREILGDLSCEVFPISDVDPEFQVEEDGQTYAENAIKKAKNKLLLHQLQGCTKRSARFRCVIAIVSPEGKVETTEGVCEGVIGTEERGRGGFGFDPIFIVPEYGKTLAELGPAIKNTISHRAKALMNLQEILPGFFM